MRINIVLLLVFICSFGATVCLSANTAEPEASHIDNILINADAIRRDNSLKYLHVFEDALNRLNSLDKQVYKEVRKKYRSAKALYRKYSFLAKETDKKIRLLKKSSPEILEQLSTIQPTSTDKVVAYLGSKVRFSSKESLGDTHIRFNAAKRSPIPSLALELEQGLILLPPQDNVIKITLATDATLPDCNHELGHYAYVVFQPDSYFHFLSKGKVSMHGDGHSHGDPSGKWALEFESMN